eukprot:g6023.t1
MYSRFGKACLTMAVTGGCCSVVLAASTEESKESVQWAYPSPYDDEDEEDVKRVDKFTLPACEAACSASENHNLTLVVRSLADLEKVGYDPADFYAQRCAIIESCPSQIDFDHKILMLEDERIMCYDTLTIVDR